MSCILAKSKPEKHKNKQTQKFYKKNPNPEYSDVKIRAFGHLSSHLWPHCYCDTKRFFHGLNAREHIFWEKTVKEVFTLVTSVVWDMQSFDKKF